MLTKVCGLVQPWLGEHMGIDTHMGIDLELDAYGYRLGA